MSKKSENLSDLNKKDRNKRHSSPFIFDATVGEIWRYNQKKQNHLDKNENKCYIKPS